MQKQPDGHSCGLFAVEYTAETLDEISSTDAVFAVRGTHGHLIISLENQKLTPCPKA